MAEELCRLEPDEDLHHPIALAQCHNALGGHLCDEQKSYAEAEPHFRQAAELFARVIERHPERTGCRLGLASSYNNLGESFYGRRLLELAENAYRQADTLLEPLMGERSVEFAPEETRALVALNWGKVHLDRGKIDEALARFDRGIIWSEAVLQKEPRYAPARERARMLHASKAATYDKMKRFREAVVEWKRCLDLSEGAEHRAFRMQLGISLLRGGDIAHAVAEADAVVAEPSCPSYLLYNGACVFALAGRPEKAVALLGKLRSAGYFDQAENLKMLLTDPDLDSLRRREDFRKLLPAPTKKAR